MGIADFYAKDIDANIGRELANPAPPEAPSFNLWSFLSAGAKGVPAGALEAFGAVRDFSSLIDQRHAEEVAAKEQRLGLSPSQPYVIPGGGVFRKKAEDFMPNPETAHQSDQVIAGLTSSVTKAVGAMLTLGPVAGSAAFGLEEADTTYQKLIDKGVDPKAAAKVAAVTGIGAGVGTILPIGGATVGKTLGLVAAGGPGIYVAQESLAKNILQKAGETKEADLHDPLDPLGLALSIAIPGVFGAFHIRGLKKAPELADVVKSIESDGRRFGKDGELLTSPKGAKGEMQVMPGTAADPGFGVTPAKDASADELARVGRDYLAAMQDRYGSPDKAMAAYNAGPGAVDAAIKAHGDDWLKFLPDETQKYVAKGLSRLGSHAAERGAADPATVDAARVKVGEDTLHASLPDAPNARAEVMRAADDLGAGVEPRPAAVPTTSLPEFKAWFGESKVVDDAGEPLVVYHGTNKSFDEFSAMIGPRSRMVGDWEGVHFTNDREQAQAIANSLARIEGGKPRVVEAYLKADNPVPFDRYKSKDQAIAAGHDARLTENNTGLQEWTVFNPKQIKAVDNSGKFDPNSASLTDPLRPGEISPRYRDVPNKLPDPDRVTEAKPEAAPAEGKAAEAGTLPPLDTARLEQLHADQPDMMVTLPGHDAPMRLADAMESAKQEADAIRFQSEMVRVAVQCALEAGAIGAIA